MAKASDHKRYICLHGHFYQPPRENPWLGAIEIEPSAHPYHDWNDRITAECYAANAAARILDDKARITKIVNNYERMSFDVGPTLMSWLESKAPETYRAILDADAAACERFSGHGSAMAQAYNHMIMPLADPGDRRTQVLWGIRDFHHRFSRQPEGMWLPETAVDLASLEVMAELGIRFIVLAPHQGVRVRRIGSEQWREVGEAGIATHRPYLKRLPSGREIAVFFYDHELASGVAFGDLLSNGELFHHKLMSAFRRNLDEPQLVHLAVDGETFGHHHRFGDMALAWVLDQIDDLGQVELTTYGEYLELFEPQWEVEIASHTSWSCAHGVERWRGDCGCRIDPGRNWSQEWRSGLRCSFDWLRDEIAPHFAREATFLLQNAWRSRDDYIQILLDNSPGAIDRFFAQHRRRELAPVERVKALEMLEIARHSMLMYTSCGWFFDEVSGLEARQVLSYAVWAARQADELFGLELFEGLLERLEAVPSNLPGYSNARGVVEKDVLPAIIGASRLTAQHAIVGLFEDYAPVFIGHWELMSIRCNEHESGRWRMVEGMTRVIKRTTGRRFDMSFCLVHYGDHNLSCGVGAQLPPAEHDARIKALLLAFDRTDLPSMVKGLEAAFPKVWGLDALSGGTQRKILDRLTSDAIADARKTLDRLYEEHVPLMRFIDALDTPLPGALRSLASTVITERIRTELELDYPQAQRLERLLDEAGEHHLGLDEQAVVLGLNRAALNRLADADGSKSDLLRFADAAIFVRLMESFDMSLSLWKLQNRIHQLADHYQRHVAAAEDPISREWCSRYRGLAKVLNLRVGN